MPPLPGTVVHVVDDDPSFRSSVARLLRAAGYTAETYASAAEFLAAAPDPAGCLLLDVHMPHVDGVQLYDVVRDRTPGLPVIFISGQNDPLLQDEVRQAGAMDCLAKPVQASTLFDAINRATAVHRDRRG
jgi:FixJ family two-component response regulator